MQSHSEMLARIKEQLAAQTSEFRDLCGALERLDSRALLPVSEELLREIELACAQRVAVGHSVPASGLRA